MKRNTILVGAGATMEIGGPTSKKLRKIIVNSCCACLEKRLPLLRHIGERLDMKSNGNFNFEDLFHIIEQLSSYNVGWQDENYDTYAQKLVTPDLAYFTRANNKKWEQKTSVWRNCIGHIIQTIAYEVNAYDTHYRGNVNQYYWYKNFWQQYSTCTDIITLNYDTTIEHSIERYIDGFGKDGVFNPSLLLKTHGRKSTTITHLHGSIVFGQNIINPNYSPIHDLSKYNSYESAKETWMNESNNVNSEDGQITPTPIITGRLKTEKLQVQPFVSYYHHLQDSFLKNERLLIIGYSFGDEHINSYIRLFKQIHPTSEIVIVAKNNVYEFPKNDGRLLSNHIEFFNDKEAEFLCSLIQNCQVCTDECGRRYFSSEEENVKFYTDGFKSFAKMCNQ